MNVARLFVPALTAIIGMSFSAGAVIGHHAAHARKASYYCHLELVAGSPTETSPVLPTLPLEGTGFDLKRQCDWIVGRPKWIPPS